MAKNSENLLIRGMSGTIGRQLTFRQRNGKTIVTKLRRPTTGTLSPKAAATRERFLKAVAYGKRVVANPVTKALYQEKVTPGLSAYTIAVTDAMTPPTVDLIDVTNYHGAVGDSIMITASDDFEVAGVQVSIQDSNGAMLETGNALLQPDTNLWLYKATINHAALAGSKITAVASDTPNNKGSLDITL